MNTQKIVIDLEKQTRNPSNYIVLRQGDQGLQTVEILVKKNGEVFSLEGLTLKFEGNLSNELYVKGNATITTAVEGEAMYTFSGLDTSVTGRYQVAFFRLYDSKGLCISSEDVIVDVKKNADLSNGEAKKYETEFTKLLNQFNQEWTTYMTDKNASHEQLEKIYIELIEKADQMELDLSVLEKKIDGLNAYTKAEADKKFFKAAQDIPESADLNDYRSEGHYNCSLNLTTKTLMNCPVQLAFSLEVTKHSGIHQKLITHPISGWLTFERNFYNNSWGEWKVTTKDNFGRRISTLPKLPQSLLEIQEPGTFYITAAELAAMTNESSLPSDVKGAGWLINTAGDTAGGVYQMWLRNTSAAAYHARPVIRITTPTVAYAWKELADAGKTQNVKLTADTGYTTLIQNMSPTVTSLKALSAYPGWFYVNSTEVQKLTDYSELPISGAKAWYVFNMPAATSSSYSYQEISVNSSSTPRKFFRMVHPTSGTGVWKEMETAPTAASEVIPTFEEGFENYSSDPTNISHCIIRKGSDGRCYMYGAIKNMTEIAAGSTVLMGRVPEGFRPIRPITSLQQASAQNSYMLTINSDGTIYMARHRNGGNASVTAVSTWLNTTVSWETV
ncbi:BppU family phage baseplate upper protein [Enterococcus sp. BWB1-3]|uniref:BppU family phage baseplate upper protein n=1 Tax=Enterococcus sp. BWB1-3 TaxID=2787713 RepID=UPI0019229630|nr:BppU family phage baseplate upper protein [Enterococcus sp. BWB1-3]MBL1229947.1 BppU family phage baseplate upper protein [Enterococcus sp. BWB1-3]